ncbi:MAG: hypothetical protein ITG02_15755, partial [Patulibacter sp.]|nr:hypothetical protein [Patulibacter sp.]
MTRARRLRAGRGLAASLVATAALAVAPAASAADCPNEAVRAQQQSQHLPNCMAYEKVTPADKNGAAPGISEVIVADGNRLLFGMNSGVGDTQGFLTGNYRATRTDAGWTFNSMTPPFNRIPPVLVDSAEFAGWSSDLERVALGTRYPVSPNDRGQQANGTRILDVYIREEDGSFTWVVPDPSVPDTSTHPVTYAGGSPDLDRVVVATARPFDDRVGTTTAQHLYVWTRTGMNLATVLPNGTVPTAMSASGGRAVSADGRRIAFTTGSGADLRVYVRYNADDPASAYTREVAVGPNGEACDSGGSSQLAGLSPDGSKLLFSCRSAILPGAPAEGVYLRDLDGGPDAVRLVGAGAATPPYGSNADYSRIYVSGLGPAFGTVALIRDGVPEQAVPSTVASGTQTTIFRSDVSSDGEHLVIQSAWDFGLSGVDAGTGDDFQVYAFSARTGEFGCVSCRQDGAPTNGSGELRGSIGNVFSRNMITPLTDNGRVAFVTPVGLDPRDTNGLQDAYAWIDGRQVLLSSGRSGEPATAQGASRDGRSFFFSTGEAMVPDDRDGGAYDIYVAREGGGFLLPDSPV